jgi:hypothetical protein
VEIDIVRAMTMMSDELGKVTDEPAWKKIAVLHLQDAILDSRSIALIKRQNPQLSPNELMAMIHSFQLSIALDTVRNEYLLHPKLYAWLYRDPSRADLDKFNEKVYAELFLTPSSDPWLGLVSKDVYTGIENNGIR